MVKEFVVPTQAGTQVDDLLHFQLMSDAHREEIRRPGEGRDPSVEALKLDPGLRRGDDRKLSSIC